MSLPKNETEHDLDINSKVLFSFDCLTQEQLEKAAMLVIRTELDNWHEAFGDSYSLDELLAKLPKNCMVVFLNLNQSIELLPEDGMAKHGWFRRGSEQQEGNQDVR